MGKKKQKTSLPVRRPTVVENDDSDEEVVLDSDPPPQGPPPELPKKKSKSSFLLFSARNRERIKSEIIARAPELYEERGPGLAEMSKELGEAWGALPDEEKKPYEDEATELKKEHDAQIEAYYAFYPDRRPLPKPKKNKKKRETNDNDESGETMPKKQQKKLKNSNRRTPLPSAYNIFARERRADLIAELSENTHGEKPPMSDVSKCLSEEWGNMSEENKARFVRTANELNASVRKRRGVEDEIKKKNKALEKASATVQSLKESIAELKETLLAMDAEEETIDGMDDDEVAKAVAAA